MFNDHTESITFQHNGFINAYKKYLDTFLSEKLRLWKGISEMIVLNYLALNLKVYKITQTQIFILVILFLAEKRWLKKGIMEMKVWVWHGIVWKCARSVYLELIEIVTISN